MTQMQRLQGPPRADADGYCSVRAYTESLASPLGPEDQVVQSMPDCSPTKWHRAHTTWFFETIVLQEFVDGYRPADEAYGYLFNSYYESIGPRQPRPRRGMITRPTVDEVTAYRRHVDAAMLALFESGRTQREPRLHGLIELGLHHEQQHQELLLMDAKHLLAQNPLHPVYAVRETSPGDARELGWTPHPGGLVQIGHSGDGFAFDNEGPRHTTYLQPFAIADRLVTCGEWLAFMDDGGYERAELWLSDGWYAVQNEQYCAPMYWEQSGDAWHVFTLHGLEPVNASAPAVHISYYEADAFARWAGKRLPTEAEWETAATQSQGDAGQWYGQAWQWTSSAYLPYPGFHPAAGAVAEYNGKFMVNQHVLRGSCIATSPGHSRATYRNFFTPPSRWAFSGLRLASDA